MIKALKRFIRNSAKRVSAGSELNYRRVSFSQEGEDLLLDRFFGFRGPGFYVDVGAHHPHRFSNTHLFYKRGWHGINIDAMPDSMEPFRRMRKRDINLEMGVGQDSAVAKFYVFNERALNTFDEATARSHNHPGWKIERIVDVQIEPLSQILSNNLPAGTAIDFFSIDVEGHDLQVLKSNDWTRFRPTMILVECLGKGLSEIQHNDTAQFLSTVGYIPYAKTVNTFFFIQETPGE